MKSNIKFGISALLVAMLLISMVFVPAVSAQPEDNYTVSVKKAFDQANAYVHYVAINLPGLENWRGASIKPDPLELYDINGKKLYYEFQIENDNKTVGRMKISANKVLGHPVKTYEVNPHSWDSNVIMQKSIEVANKKYPNANVTSTKMVVYSYPSIGAMTSLKDKITGKEYRIFVDACTLEVIPDKVPTEIEKGVWSIYEEILKENKEENIAKWENCDEFASRISKEITELGIDMYNPLSEQDYTQLETLTPMSSSSRILNVPLYGGQYTSACALASAQMIAAYYNIYQNQDYISTLMNNHGIYEGCTQSDQLQYYRDPNGCDKPGSFLDTSPTYGDAVYEIDNYRPLKSGITGHARVCRGYYNYDYGTGVDNLLYINDPSPLNQGDTYWEDWDDILHTNYIYVLD